MARRRARRFSAAGTSLAASTTALAVTLAARRPARRAGRPRHGRQGSPPWATTSKPKTGATSPTAPRPATSRTKPSVRPAARSTNGRWYESRHARPARRRAPHSHAARRTARQHRQPVSRHQVLRRPRRAQRQANARRPAPGHSDAARQGRSPSPGSPASWSASTCPSSNAGRIATARRSACAATSAAARPAAPVEPYWPGMFILFRSATSGKYDHDFAQISVRAKSNGQDVPGPDHRAARLVDVRHVVHARRPGAPVRVPRHSRPHRQRPPVLEHALRQQDAVRRRLLRERRQPRQRPHVVDALGHRRPAVYVIPPQGQTVANLMRAPREAGTNSPTAVSRVFKALR